MTALPSPARQRLTQLAAALRHFHSALLDHTRSDYEFQHGHIGGPFALYSLVMNHPHFQWLRPLSGLMATLDEVLDSREPLTERHLQDARAALASLMQGSDTRFAEFRSGYTRAAADPRVRETEEGWRRLLASSDV